MTRIPPGVGLGLRWEFLDELRERWPDSIDFVEVSPENYMRRGGKLRRALEDVADHYPLVTHGLSMSMGGFDPLDADYLRDLAHFAREVNTPWHSDHLCFGSAAGVVLHDLLPIAFTEAGVERVADRLRRAQDVLGIPLAVENISYYLRAERAGMKEPEFITRLCERADCGLLLDVNNAYVNAANFGEDAATWLRNVPLHRVVQIHVAGHEWFDEDGDRLIVDTHGADVCDPVLALLAEVLRETGPVPVLLERDHHIGSLDSLLHELARVRSVCTAACSDRPTDDLARLSRPAALIG